MGEGGVCIRAERINRAEVVDGGREGGRRVCGAEKLRRRGKRFLPRATPKEHRAANPLTVAQWDPHWDSDIQNCKKGFCIIQAIKAVVICDSSNGQGIRRLMGKVKLTILDIRKGEGELIRSVLYAHWVSHFCELPTLSCNTDTLYSVVLILIVHVNILRKRELPRLF